LTSEEKI
jgi:hypothetical protein